MKTTTLIISAILATSVTPISLAQQAVPLLREGDPIPSVGAGHTITSLNTATVNGIGGFAITLNSTDGISTLSSVWGAQVGVAPTILRTESIIGVLDQTSFESSCGLDNLGSVCYSPSANDLMSGVTSLDGVWVDNAIIAIEDQPIPSLPGKIWRFGSRPGITQDGKPAWIGGINDQATGANEGNGLFLNGTPLLKTGDMVPGLPGALDGNAVDFDFRVSALGTNYITATDVITGSSSTDGWIVMNGAPITTSLGSIAEDQPLPQEHGGMPLEKWDNFDFFGINEAGEYFWTGDTDAAPTNVDEYVARNSRIIYREGDVLDGETLTGSIEAAYMNQLGDIVFIWDVVEGTSDVEALFLNGKLLLKEGDAVDLDGDGTIEPTSIISGFTGSMVAIGENRRIFFTADIDVNGTTTTTDDIETFFQIDDPCGSVKSFNVGCPGTGGFVPQLQLNGCSEAGGSVTLEISRGLNGSTALVFFGTGRAMAPLGSGCFLNLSGVLPSITALPLGGAAPGEGSISVPAIIPTGTPQITFTMQAFVTDPGSPIGGAGTNGLEITILP